MAFHSRTKYVVYSFATLFILLSPVTAGGYAFDTATCSPAAIDFLTVEMKRAVTTCSNVLTFLDIRRNELPDNLMEPIYSATGTLDLIPSIFAVFGGGEIRNRYSQGWIEGIESYDTLLPNYDSTSNAANAADVEGNLFISCNADQLGESHWNEAGNYHHTHDEATETYFAQPYQNCAPGSAAFFVHPISGRADRVRICDWVLNEFVALFSAGQPWDTRLSINHMRTLAPADPAEDPESIEGQQQVAAFIQARNEALGHILPGLVGDYNLGLANDIDLSIGFDTWLIYILTQTRAGGLRQGINTVDSRFLLPTDGWTTARSQARLPGGGLQFSRFLIDEFTGSYRALRGGYEPPDFGSDEIPIPDMVVIEDPPPHPNIIEDDE